MKRNPDGSIRYKARIVIKCYDETGFEETYAPVGTLTTLWYLIFLVGKQCRNLDHLDVVTVFLNPQVNVIYIYMTIPDGWPERRNASIFIVRLTKAVRCFEQATRLWHNDIITFLLYLEFTQSQANPNIDLCSDGILMLLYINNISMLSLEDATKAALRVTARLSEKCMITNLSTEWQFLSITMHRDENGTGIRLGQQAITTTTIVKPFIIQNAHEVPTQMDPDVQLDLAEDRGEKVLKDITGYQAIVGSLMHAALVTWADISFTVAALRCYNSQPFTSHISKKHFCPGGMAASEWTRSVRAVRDTPAADCSVPGINDTRRVAYHPQIADLEFLLALSGSEFKQTLWLCCQLWPYIGMDSLGSRSHRDCYAMGDSAIISPRVPSTFSSMSVGKRWEDMILPGREDPRDCVDPRNLGQWEWDQKLGKIKCVFWLYDKMRWNWDADYLPQGLPNIYSASHISRLLPLYLHTPPVTPWQDTWRPWSCAFWRCTWRPQSCELRDALGGCDRWSLEMHWESVIEGVWRCTWRPWSSEFGHALGGRDRVNSEMHSEVVTEQVWSCTCSLWSSDIGGVLGGGRFGGRRDGSWDSIHWLTCSLMSNWPGAGDCRSWDDAVLGECCTMC